MNVEEDEAGRLARFRERFGRGWDAESATTGGEEVCSANRDLPCLTANRCLQGAEGEEQPDDSQSQDSLMDLISGYGQEQGKSAGVLADKKSSGKGKGGQK